MYGELDLHSRCSSSLVPRPPQQDGSKSQLHLSMWYGRRVRDKEDMEAVLVGAHGIGGEGEIRGRA